MLDCANGYQKENQQEVSNVKEERRQKVIEKAVNTPAGRFKEDSKEETRSEESCS